jgi:hypothetical protein
MEGNMRGPSIQDCEKSYARTGVPSRNLLAKRAALAGASAPSAQRAYETITWVAESRLLSSV